MSRSYDNRSPVETSPSEVDPLLHTRLIGSTNALRVISVSVSLLVLVIIMLEGFAKYTEHERILMDERKSQTEVVIRIFNSVDENYSKAEKIAILQRMGLLPEYNGTWQPGTKGLPGDTIKPPPTRP